MYGWWWIEIFGTPWWDSGRPEAHAAFNNQHSYRVSDSKNGQHVCSEFISTASAERLNILSGLYFFQSQCTSLAVFALVTELGQRLCVRNVALRSGNLEIRVGNPDLIIWVRIIIALKIFYHRLYVPYTGKKEAKTWCIFYSEVKYNNTL